MTTEKSVQKKAEEKKPIKAEPKPKAKIETKAELRPVRKPKEITSAELLEDYKALYDKFTAYEAQQKKAKKAFRHCVVARRRIEVHSMNFRRNCR